MAYRLIYGQLVPISKPTKAYYVATCNTSYKATTAYNAALLAYNNCISAALVNYRAQVGKQLVKQYCTANRQVLAQVNVTLAPPLPRVSNTAYHNANYNWG